MRKNLGGVILILHDPKTREEWLNLRTQGIGGSDAASILGLNKYKSNLDLYYEKTGIKKNNFSGNDATEYGKKAEEHIRGLFLLDYDFYSEYHEYRMYANDEHKFLYATLDGELTDKYGKRGVLEIKTTTIRNPKQWDEWDNKIPDSYYVQVLHQLLATGWDYAWLRAYIRYFKGDDLRVTIKDYYINRADVIDDLEELLKAEIKFWDAVVNKKEPGLIMPGI